MAANAGNAHHQHRDHAEGEDDRLAGVEHRQRDVSLDAESLVARHRTVVARRLARLGAEILDRLEIEQAVDRLGVGVGVAFVHRAANADAPVGGDRRVDEIDEHRDGDRQHVAPVERVKKRRRDQHELYGGGHRHQHRGAHNRLDRVAPALEHARQAAGLALKVEAQRELVKMDKHFIGEPAHRIHRHCGEQRVAPLLGQRHQDAHHAIERGQGDGAGQEAADWRGCNAGRRGQRVRRPF